MTDNIMISVIVPIYNVESYLEQCLNSICHQTCSNLEIILVDDGSKDSSGKICDGYASIDSRIRVIHKENGGLVSARKAGVDASHGEYITFVDGDDWIEETTYGTLVDQYLCRYGADIVAFGCIEEYPDFQKLVRNSVPEGLYEADKLASLKKRILVGECFFEWTILPHLCTKLIKKDLLCKHICNVPDYVTFGEDAVCSFPCMMEAKSLYVSEATPYHYRQRAGSIAKATEELPEKNFVAIHHIFSNYFHASPGMELQLKQYMFFILLLKKYSSLSNLMPLFPFSKVNKKDRVFVYGAGGFGSIVERFVANSDEIELVGWTDKRADFYRTTIPQIKSREELLKTEYDCVVIAILNENIAEQVKRELMELGVEEEKIDWVRGSVLEKLKLPKSILKNEDLVI